MMTQTSELNLECKPRSYSFLVKTLGEQVASNGGNDQTEKLQDFLARLEEERLKIDAFKRELPLCMQLLNNAMETSRQQLQTYRANRSSPVLEEFIPTGKNSNGAEIEKASVSIDNKANWMTSAQLWSQTESSITTATATANMTNGYNPTTLVTPNDKEIHFNTKQRNGGAFLPFSKERNSPCSTPTPLLPELALSSGEKETDHEEIKGGNYETDNQTTTNTTAAASGTATSSQTNRKTRRCWSPELHRRFVNALQMLGGSQVATPKQIRELMKVDGLTNDEVKSHLQKYRLHTRRPSPTPHSAAGNPPPHLVVLGGIWVPPEYATATGTQTLYTNPQFYTNTVLPPPPPPHHHHQLINHHNHMYKPSSQTTGGGNHSESIDDGKSESGGSWKAESGGDGNGDGGTKALMLREDCEESNGSEIRLKF